MIGEALETLEDRRLMTYGAARFAAGTPAAFDFSPQAAVLADFNGDGNLDLATFGLSSSRIGVALGNGDGSFQPPLYLQLPSNNTAVNSLAVGDFNKDGKPDLAATVYLGRYPSTAVDVFINTSTAGGPPSFDAPTSTNVGDNARSLVVGDFNGDGVPDVAVAYSGNTFSNGVGVLLGQGDGSFQPVVTTFMPGSVSSLATGDFNGDGKDDLAVIHYERLALGNLGGVLLSQGNGSFRPMTDLGVGTNATSLTVADFNRDGRLDVAVVASVNVLNDSGADQATVLLGDGAGAFAKRTSIPLASAPTAVAAADLNGSGKLDLTVLTPADDSLTVLYGDGRGGFVRLRPRQSVFPVEADPSRGSIAVGRVADRTLPDVVVAGGSSGHVNVMLNRSRLSRPMRRHR